MLDFFSKNGAIFKKENISYKPVNEKWLYDINAFNNKKSGIYDAINQNHDFLKKNKINIKTMPKKILMDLIINNPQILNMPICLQYTNDNILKKVFIGFLESEYETALKTVGHTSYFSNNSKSFVYDDCCIECQIRELRNATDEKA
ncbi:MAG: hypothetical protein RR665_02370 [Malacoplasma sp.]